MYRVIGGRGCGKTHELMLLAKQTGAAIACSNPITMQQKAYAYGITGIEFISYSQLFQGAHEGSVMIDELETFAEKYIDCKLTGYSLTNED